jgi:hypothetical protein
LILFIYNIIIYNILYYNNISNSMTNTRKKYNKKTKKRGNNARNCNCSNSRSNMKNGNNRSAKMIEIFNRNKKRNRMIRNIRMGRSTFSRIYGGQLTQSGGAGASPFVGQPWSPSGTPNTGNYFAPSPNGVGTGLVPILDDGQPLPPGNARFPTQLGPQLMKGSFGGGGGKNSRSSKSSKRNKYRGGGIVSDFNSLVANASYKFNDFNSKLDGMNPPPNPNPYDQPIQSM